MTAPRARKTSGGTGGSSAQAGTAASMVPAEEIKAVPVRHPGRWIAAVVVLVLFAMLVHTMVTNPRFE